MSRQARPMRPLAAAAAFVTVLAAFVTGTSRPGWTDDRDLLRFNTSKPYLFIVLDTSRSMNLGPDGSWVPGSGDDPGSKLYQAKQVVYEVFQDVDDVHFGFASLNQDALRVRAKHWVYRAPSSTPFSIDFPAADTLWTFGRHLESGGAEIPGGTCADPLDLDDAVGRAKADRFSKLDVDGLGPTEMYVQRGGNKYRVTIAAPANQPDGSQNRMGRNRLHVDVLVERVANPVCNSVVSSDGPHRLVFDYVREFVMVEDDAGFSDPGGGGGGNATESMAGFWDYADALQNADCSDAHPFTGVGWEGNYDGSFTDDPTFANPVSNLDPYGLCLDRGDPSLCSNLKYPTAESPLGRPLDLGDMIPLDWQVENRSDFLSRLAPNHPDGGVPNYGIASYFEDLPGPDGYLPLKNSGRRPLIGLGQTPLGKSVVDFRCYYLGSQGNKCRNTAYDPGWEAVALEEDPEWGCRRPYLIVISDGEDTCGGENPCADTADLNSRGGVRTWVLAYGADCDSIGNPLSCMAQNGKGELVCPQDPQALKDELNRILGLIREEARSFASAAVPTVEATADQTIILSNFTPLNNKSVWDGHLHSFLKPLPLDEFGRPDTGHPNHLWDAGEELEAQAPTQAQADAGTLSLGTGQDERRVFYSRLRTSTGPTEGGEWPTARRLFDWTADGTAPEIRYDLWQGLAVPFSEDADFNGDGTIDVDQTAQGSANQAISDALAIKEHTLINSDGTTVDIQYVLGDIFHSDPVVAGSPPNTKFFIDNVGDDGTECEDGNPSYRCFFQKHQFRRKLLMVGANDGMFHAFDVGIFEQTGVGPNGEVEGEFNNGTGREVFAYSPREVLPTVRQIDPAGGIHRFSVDGTVKISDAFIDPLHNGTPDPTEREWRTVAVSGLREGGSGYFALDVTQPDSLSADFVPQPGSGYVPSCMGSPLALDPGPSGSCGPLPFPAALWEFDDSVLDATIVDPAVSPYVRLDEDANGVADLGNTWSTPNLVRIRVCTGANCDPNANPNDVEDRYVAVFGGGMLDAGDKLNPQRGDYLYMVDIETGQAIYKRRLVAPGSDPSDPTSGGAAPSEPAAVDTDQDGFVDRIYIGTLGGFMYRVDLVADSAGNYPELSTVQVTDLNGVTHDVERIDEDSLGDPAWEPRVIFNTNFDGNAATAVPRQIYHRPSVIFVARLGLYALAFGTGDREDLWSPTSDQEGRFYLFVDDTNPGDAPYTEADLAEVEAADADLPADTDLLVSDGGWFMVLEPQERVITDAFALSGVTFFSSFQPDIQVSGDRDPRCSKTGESRIFVVNTTNANGFLQDAAGTDTRFLQVNTFVTNPFAEQAQTKNPDSGGNTGGTGDDLDQRLTDVMESLKTLFPNNCKFANYRIDIKTIASDTDLVFIAPVPVCIIDKNWKEF